MTKNRTYGLHGYQQMAPDADPRPLCRHCQATLANRPRGLCSSCYQNTGVREQYPSESPYANRRDAAPLDAEADGTVACAGPEADSWYVCGRDQDGARTVISSHSSETQAVSRAHRLVAGGVDYAGITVEQHLQPPVLRLTGAPDRTDPMNRGVPWQRTRELREPVSAVPPNPEPLETPTVPPAPTTPPPAPSTNGHAEEPALNNHERGNRIKAVMEGLGRDATYPEVCRKLQEAALGVCAPSTWKHWRLKLFGDAPKRMPGPPPGTPRPALKATAPIATPTAEPPQVTAVDPMTLVRLDRLCRALGGAARVREMLALLEE